MLPVVCPWSNWAGFFGAALGTGLLSWGQRGLCVSSRAGAPWAAGGRKEIPGNNSRALGGAALWILSGCGGAQSNPGSVTCACPWIPAMPKASLGQWVSLPLEWDGL